jgi:serine/threonine protein kinase
LARESEADMANGSPPQQADGGKLPARIDRYEPLRKLAVGGMAELFLAKQSGMEGFEKLVVIKRILSHLAQDDVFVNMFLDEARIAAKLSHANIVQIYDLGKADDSYYIAMEYISGRNVQHLIAKELEESRFIPIEYSCRIIAGVCEGLHYAHTRRDYDRRPLNIVHRDISPQNILVSFAGGVKVVDFGIAKAATQVAQTRAGVLKGKYAYMSPEQVRGAKQIDHRSDIFSVGLVMYEMLTGRRAFERDSSIKTLKAIVQDKPLNPTELNPEIPTAVIKLLSRALEKNPDRRYKNAQEMQLAVEDYLEKSPKKANTVRLSRYMFELFDEDIKTEGGTMVVEGIGEVIIPTGQGEQVKANVNDPNEKPVKDFEESSDSRTAETPLIPPRKSKNGAEEAENSADEKATLLQVPQIREEDLRQDEEEESDEEDDKTIPVYDLEDYERIRAQRGDQAEERKGLVVARDYDSPSHFDSEAPTVGIEAINSEDLKRPTLEKKLAKDDAATEEIGAHEVAEAKRKAAAKIAERESLLSLDDDAPTLNFDPKDHDIDLKAIEKDVRKKMASEQATIVPEVDRSMTAPGDAVANPANWEDSDLGTDSNTASLDLNPPKQSAGEGGLYSTEAVVGSGGVIHGVQGGPIRPAGAPAVRPSMTAQPGAAPIPVKEKNRHLELQVAGVAEIANTLTGPVANSVSPAAANHENSSTMIRILVGVMSLIFIAALGTVIYAFVFLPAKTEAGANTQIEYVQAEILSEPPGAQVQVNGQAKGTTPLNVFLAVGDAELVLTLDGHESVTEKIVLGKGESVTKKISLPAVKKKKDEK